jgi:DNA-binding response OmpR family regulator
MIKRVLFIDDEPHFLNSIERTMRQQKEGWEISVFPKALEALEFLKENGPAVIVSDWRMPEMNGIEFCRQVRELEGKEELQDCYIMLLTGNLGTHNLVEALEKGADDFINKPCDFQELKARIRVGLRVINLQNDLRMANKQLEAFARSMAR